MAVVGSRSATSYGAEMAAGIAADLAAAGQTVVSGAAFGIDQAAHRGSLAMGGPTVAVLACGADRAYPVAHKPLLDHLAATGAVVSEAPLGCAPTRIRFLARNRLIAALTGGTVVIEAALRSGALNTANWAGRLNRPLLGVPGPVTSAPSPGGAPADPLRQRHPRHVGGGGARGRSARPGTTSSTARAAATPPATGSTQRHKQVLDAVPLAHDVAADSIARTAGMGLMEVRSALTRLDALGMVERSASGWRLAEAARS